jgi:hypothetical protein
MKTHWKKLFNPNYMGAYSLEPGQEIALTIARVVTEKVTNADGRAEDCMICYWKENEKPMILNKTNATAVAKATGSNYIEEWIGNRVSIYLARVKAFGDTVEALRIREKAPQPKRTLNEAEFARMKESIQSGKFSAESAKEKFSLTPEQIAAL